jgi:hypothetical protein
MLSRPNLTSQQQPPLPGRESMPPGTAPLNAYHFPSCRNNNVAFHRYWRPLITVAPSMA